ncbi:autotransporter outer membrane beta-barrel domain-containing protein [Pseudomonas sp. F1_0610]|uniref:autotransporter outer membrane beta-barrel domain-containing protein n=1 Tax=Pseudomonas sp. F1_0610 TaxID=3114284 RepID=UPI0039C085E4
MKVENKNIFKFSLLVVALTAVNISSVYATDSAEVGIKIGDPQIHPTGVNFHVGEPKNVHVIGKGKDAIGIQTFGERSTIGIYNDNGAVNINSVSDTGAAYGIKSENSKYFGMTTNMTLDPNHENFFNINVSGATNKKSAGIFSDSTSNVGIIIFCGGLNITAHNADGINVKVKIGGISHLSEADISQVENRYQLGRINIKVTSDVNDKIKRSAIYFDGEGSSYIENYSLNIESSSNAIYLKNEHNMFLITPNEIKSTVQRYKISGDIVLESESKLNLDGIDYLKTNITKISGGKAEIILSKGGNNWKSQWDITGNSDVNSLELNNSLVQFMNKPAPVNTMARLNSNAGFYTLNIEEKLTVNGGGTFILNTNGVDSDHIYVKEMEGKAHLFVKDNGSANATVDSQLALAKIDIKDVDSGFIVNDFEAGGYQFSAKEVNGEYVANTNGRSHGSVLSSSANVAANSMVGNYLTNLVETKNILNRVSDIRNNKADNNLWIRGYNGKINAFESGLLSGFDMKYNALQIGWDNKLSVNTQGNFYLGAVVGYTYGDQDHNFGSAKLKSYNASLYGSYMTEDHLYADVVLKYARLNNDFKVTSLGGNSVKGDTKTNSYSLSAGVGKRIYLNSKDQGWFIEPQAQLTATHIDAASYRASNGLRVKLDSQNSTLGRFGGSVGYDINQSSLPTTIYAKAALVREFAGGADYYLNNAKEHHSFKGSWGQYGIGVSTNFTPNQQLYVDFEADRGGRFKQRQLNVGYSLSF